MSDFDPDIPHRVLLRKLAIQKSTRDTMFLPEDSIWGNVTKIGEEIPRWFQPVFDYPEIPDFMDKKDYIRYIERKRVVRGRDVQRLHRYYIQYLIKIDEDDFINKYIRPLLQKDFIGCTSKREDHVIENWLTVANYYILKGYGWRWTPKAAVAPLRGNYVRHRVRRNKKFKISDLYVKKN